MDAQLPILRIDAPQPIPLSCHVNHINGWTHVARLFAPEQVSACRLCPRHLCTADRNGLCLISYPYHLPDDRASLHRMPVGTTAARIDGLTVDG